MTAQATRDDPLCLRLPQSVDYALRALVSLARSGSVGPVRCRALAEEQQVSERFLQIVLAVLRDDGIVRGTRGVHGGYQLVESLEKVTVGRIVRLLIPWRDLHLRHSSEANSAVKPLLHDLLVDLNVQFLDALDYVTVAQVAAGTSTTLAPGMIRA